MPIIHRLARSSRTVGRLPASIDAVTKQPGLRGGRGVQAMAAAASSAIGTAARLLLLTLVMSGFSPLSSTPDSGIYLDVNTVSVRSGEAGW